VVANGNLTWNGALWTDAISSNTEVRTQEWVVEPTRECENQVFANLQSYEKPENALENGHNYV